MILTGCSKGPQPLNFGTDQCEHCRMTISDKKFGAEIVNDKGKAFKFDAAECMIKYLTSENTDENNYMLLVIDYNQPETLIDAKSAAYIVSPLIKSPMGEDLAAFKSKKDAEEELNKIKNGNIYTWDEIKNKLK